MRSNNLSLQHSNQIVLIKKKIIYTYIVYVYLYVIKNNFFSIIIHFCEKRKTIIRIGCVIGKSQLLGKRKKNRFTHRNINS